MWWEKAACQGMNPMFDLDRDDYESTDESRALELGVIVGPGRSMTRQMRMVERMCRRTCNECPVLTECLEDAIKHRDTHTFRGGLNARERTELMVRMGIELEVAS